MYNKKYLLDTLNYGWLLQIYNSFKFNYTFMLPILGCIKNHLIF